MPWFAGVERDQIYWSPVIDPEKCIGCGLCMNCGKAVYSWGNDFRSHVEKPLDCVVGCSTCANLCPGKAIHFPDLSELRATYKKYKIWTHVKHAMLDAGKITLKQRKSIQTVQGII